MSIPVALDELRAAIEGRAASPYLLTVSDDQRPHSVSVALGWDGDELVMGAGNRTMANASSRPDVALLWPPDEPGGYSLIVDGTVSGTSGAGDGDNVVRVQPTRAVLHRPAAPAADAGACGSDCVPLLGP